MEENCRCFANNLIARRRCKHTVYSVVRRTTKSSYGRQSRHKKTEKNEQQTRSGCAEEKRSWRPTERPPAHKIFKSHPRNLLQLRASFTICLYYVLWHCSTYTRRTRWKQRKHIWNSKWSFVSRHCCIVVNWRGKASFTSFISFIVECKKGRRSRIFVYQLHAVHRWWKTRRLSRKEALKK